jgi:hypothetical protein
LNARPTRDTVAIWAISWWPALNFCAANGEIVQRNGISSLGMVAAISLAISLTGYALYRLFRRNPAVVAFWVAAIVLAFSYSIVRGLAERLFTAAGLSWPPFIVWMGVAVLVLALMVRFARVPGVHRAGLVFAFAAPAVATVMAGSAWLRTATTDTRDVAAAQIPRSVPRTPVDVYYIILDTYAGVRSLQRDFGFDNSPFLSRMAAFGFRDVSSERSNYLLTVQSLAGIFRLDYAETEDPKTWRDPRIRYPAIFDRASPPMLIAEWRALGYETWFAGGVLSGCPARHMRCLGKSNTGPIAYTTQTFMAPTPLGKYFIHLLDARRDAIAPIEESIDTLMSRKRPTFVFAHNLQPHSPFTVDRECRPRDDDGDWGPEAIAAARAAYIGVVECVNLRVTRLMEKILARDPSALIVVQSDHGSGFRLSWNVSMSDWTEDAIRERASYLNLVRAPESCQRWLDRPLGQVNTARFVLACVEGRAPVYLPERTHLSTYADGAEAGVVRLWRPTEDAAPKPQ